MIPGIFRRRAALRRALRPALAFILLASLGGCSTLYYYTQSAEGELDLLARRRPIPELIRNPDTPPALRAKLERVLEIRNFASRSLHLPDNGSYRSYVALDRPYVVWTVVAAPEFSLAPVTWCFPVAGCVSYRGYFHRDVAEAFARTLRGKGDDVAVNGVTAYSTLGWFDDPVPSTVIDEPGYAVAGLIFHELAHQRLYVQGDSAFNESFAVTVQREGVRRWLAAHGNAREQADFERFERRQRVFLRLVSGARKRLGELYARHLPAAQTRRLKAREFEDLRAGYRRARAGWSGGPTWDAWFDRHLNNADLVSVATYHSLVPAFQRLLAQEGGDLQAFYRACRSIARLPAARRAARLRALGG